MPTADGDIAKQAVLFDACAHLVPSAVTATAASSTAPRVPTAIGKASAKTGGDCIISVPTSNCGQIEKPEGQIKPAAVSSSSSSYDVAIRSAACDSNCECVRV